MNTKYEVDDISSVTLELHSLAKKRNDADLAEREQSKAEIKELGQLLHEKGGFPLMVSVCENVKRRDPVAARWIELQWDGIGEWRG
jgi:hypothetical protein